MYAPLPSKYEFLLNEPGPKILVEALRFHGLREKVGKGSNPVILGWAKDLGIGSWYTDDDIPWSGVGMAWVAKQTGRPYPKEFYRARSWESWGVKSERASLGDVLSFIRKGGGHVGTYVGEDASNYHVLGFNQSNGCTITRIAKERCTAVRRPEWSIAPPPNRRPVFLSATGPISSNEA
jgi:uncharacterized protein (TIGR02594 family)